MYYRRDPRGDLDDPSDVSLPMYPWLLPMGRSLATDLAPVIAPRRLI